MVKNCKDLSTMAANWWSEKIQSSGAKNLSELGAFTDSLAYRIDKLLRVKGSLILSTYQSPCNLLDEVAFEAGLDVKMPKGYEMRIVFNTVSVYNSHGILISTN